MAKMDEKTYLVVAMLETDGEPVIRRMTAAEIEKFASERHHGGFCIIDGNLIKSFDSKFDKGRLR